MVALRSAPSFPGKILPVTIKPGQEFVAQKMSFLASEMSVDLAISFNQKLERGFFGGEGFIMQRLSGNGMAFLECDGSFERYDLKAGQSMVVDTGNPPCAVVPGGGRVIPCEPCAYRSGKQPC